MATVIALAKSPSNVTFHHELMQTQLVYSLEKHKFTLFQGSDDFISCMFKNDMLCHINESRHGPVASTFTADNKAC